MGKRKQKKTPPKAGSRRGSSRSVEDEEIPPAESAGADYERQRQSRIEENRAKLAALGLPSMAASLAPNRSDEVPDKEDDEEYRPNMDGEDGDEDELSSSSEAFVDEDDDDDDYVNKPLSSLKSKKSSGKKKVCVKKKKIVRELDFMDEDEALKKAIAFSLEDSGVGCEGVKGSRGKGRSLQLTPKNKGRKSVNANRVQLNEDDVVIHFCQFDEIGKGSINLRDLERMASSHDFTWTDQELMDMIRCFDADGDRKLTIEDFRNIVIRCNMLQASEHP